MSSRPILSFCIASYNQGKNLVDKIKKILQYQGSEIEIVVSDNCSTDETLQLLRTVSDGRFRLKTNEINQGPTVNYMRALDSGTGKYVVFLTDKDHIETKNLEIVIQTLSQNDFACGYFELDYNSDNGFISYYKDLKSCLYKFAYLSKHPTGYIYNNDMLKSMDILNKFSNYEVVGPFPFEFLCANFSLSKNCVILSVDLFKTARLASIDSGERSMTYSSKNNNLFFTPENRFRMFERYVTHLNSLQIPQKLRLEFLIHLSTSTFSEATSGYLRVISSEPHRHHYRVASDSLEKFNLSKIQHKLLRSFRKTNIFKNSLEKTYVIEHFVLRLMNEK